MTGQDLGQADIGESIAEALAGPEPMWVTLPGPQEELPNELRAALDEFDSGERPAALAAREWLRTQAVDSYETSRTRLLIAEQRIAGFYSLAASQVEFRQSDRRRAGFDPVRVPAALVTWIAKDKRAEIDGKLLLLHAAGTAVGPPSCRRRPCSSSTHSTSRSRRCGASASAFERRPKSASPSGSGCRSKRPASGCDPAARARRGRRQPPRGTTGPGDPVEPRRTPPSLRPRRSPRGGLLAGVSCGCRVSKPSSVSSAVRPIVRCALGSGCAGEVGKPALPRRLAQRKPLSAFGLRGLAREAGAVARNRGPGWSRRPDSWISGRPTAAAVTVVVHCVP